MKTENNHIKEHFEEVTEDILEHSETKEDKAKARNKRIKKEKSKLKLLFKKCDKDKIKIVLPIIERIAFLTVQIEDLEHQVNEHGSIIWFENGKQEMWIESPSSKLLLKAQKNYLSFKKQLDLYVKEFIEEVPKEEADKFVNPRQRLLKVK